MLNIYYDSDVSLDTIDCEEGLGFGTDASLNPNFRKVVCNHPERIQNVMAKHNVNLTLDECVGLYHSWSQYRYAAGWMNSIDDMDDRELYKVINRWLMDICANNINRLTNIMQEAFKSKV